MRVYYDKTRENHVLDFTGRAEQLLEKLAINSQTVVITKNGAIITEDEELTNDDEIKILSVVSGG